MRQTAAGAFVVLVAVAAAPSQSAAPPTYADVALIFADRCVMCHTGDRAPAGLRLDSLDAIVKGSARGPVVKPGAAAESELVRRIKGTSVPRMPMTGPPFLADSDIALIEQWVDGGLRKEAASTQPAPAPAAPRRPGPGERVTYADIAPIFATRCVKCHEEKGLMGPAPEGFLLATYESTLAATDRVRVVPGNPDASELVRRIRGQARPRMPFDGPPYLDADDIRLVEQWVSQGALAADGRPATVPIGAEVRLHGTLQSQSRLDGLDLVVGRGTRIDKSPGPGDYVEVRGRLNASGGVVVERLRRR